MDESRDCLYVLRMSSDARLDGWTFTLSSIRHAEHPPQAAFTALPQWSTDLHLIHTLEGEGTLRVGRRELVARPDRVVTVPVFEPCSWCKRPGTRWTMLNLHVRILDPTGQALHEQALLPEDFTPPDLPAIHAQLRAWHQAHNGDDPRHAGLAALGALSLAGTYLARFGRTMAVSSAGGDARILRLAAHLRDHAHLPFDIDALLEGTGLGRSQCDRLFRSTFGLSPKAYWTRHRLGFAQAMLTGTNLGIRAIADRLGFSDIYYFSRWFRQHAGVTATLFRRLSREL